MSMEWIKLGWDIGVTLISVAAFLVAWFGRRDEAHKKAVEAVAQDLEQKTQNEANHYSELRHEIADVQARISVVEENIKHLPTANDLHSLQNAISQLSAGIGKLEGAQHGLIRQVDLMNSYLMRTEKV
jgi:septal ring factor EnvC (AmiA/AmiB activator)